MARLRKSGGGATEGRGGVLGSSCRTRRIAGSPGPTRALGSRTPSFACVRPPPCPARRQISYVHPTRVYSRVDSPPFDYLSDSQGQFWAFEALGPCIRARCADAAPAPGGSGCHGSHIRGRQTAVDGAFPSRSLVRPATSEASYAGAVVESVVSLQFFGRGTRVVDPFRRRYRNGLAMRGWRGSAAGGEGGQPPRLLFCGWSQLVRLPWKVGRAEIAPLLARKKKVGSSRRLTSGATAVRTVHGWLRREGG